MADAVYETGKALFDALMRGDREATIAAFADDAEIFDPHYPRPLMRGKAAIRAGLENIPGVATQRGAPRQGDA